MATTNAAGDGPTTALRDAHETLRIERRRVVDEREAFETFRSRVSTIPTESGPTAENGSPAEIGSTTGQLPLRGDGAGGGPNVGRGFGGHSRGGAAGAGRTPGSSLVAIRDAYVETVMSVPHCEAEYDDTYEASLAAEFGPDLAVALTQEPTLHDRYKELLLSKTVDTIDERDAFLDTLDVEQASLDRATERLLSITEELATLSGSRLADLDYGTLDAYRVRTETLEESCDAIATRRQRELAEVDRSLRLGNSVPNVATYLYQDLSVTYPVLATVAVVGDRLRDLRQSIEREMIDRR